MCKYCNDDESKCIKDGCETCCCCGRSLLEVPSEYEYDMTHDFKVKILDVDTTEEFIMNEDFPLKGWRRYRIEYGGHAEECLCEGVVYLPRNADSNAIVQLIMGMQAHGEIWK